MKPSRRSTAPVTGSPVKRNGNLPAVPGQQQSIGTATKMKISVRAGWFGDPAGGRTHTAGKLNANPFGLFDIHGNVWEWVQDGWDASYYGQSQEKPAINPNNPFSAGSERVFSAVAFLGLRRVPLPVFGSRHFDKTLVSYLLIGFRVPLAVDGVKAAIASSNTIDSAKAKRRFASDEWIDVIPLIDPWPTSGMFLNGRARMPGVSSAANWWWAETSLPSCCCHSTRTGRPLNAKLNSHAAQERVAST